MRIAITRPIPEAGIKLLRQHHEVVVHEDKVLSVSELKDFIKGADIVISLLSEKLTEEVLESAKDTLKAICQFTVGFDNIDVEAAKRLGIIVTNTPGSISANAVAEHAVNLMFSLARHTDPADKFMRAGKYKQWDPNLFLGYNLFDKTVGIIGTGQIGSVFAGICHNGLRMRVLYTDMVRNERLEKELGAKKVTQEHLLAEADVVSLHVPLLPTTRHLINQDSFKIMKPSAILINTARGPVVDEKALVKALKDKEIYGAGLDVFEFEPELTEGLTDLDNVIITPHIASATESTRIGMAEAAARNALAIIRGEEPPNRVA